MMSGTRTGIILNGSTESSKMFVEDMTCCGFVFGAFVSASAFSILRSTDGENYYPVIDSDTGAEKMFLIPSTGMCFVPVDVGLTLGATFLKLKMSNAVTADRTVRAETYKV